MIDRSIVKLYEAILIKNAKLYTESGMSKRTGHGWINVYVSWREGIKSGVFKRVEYKNTSEKDLSRIKKFAVEFRQDTGKSKYTRIM